LKNLQSLLGESAPIINLCFSIFQIYLSRQFLFWTQPISVVLKGLHPDSFELCRDFRFPFESFRFYLWIFRSLASFCLSELEYCSLRCLVLHHLFVPECPESQLISFPCFLSGQSSIPALSKVDRLFLPFLFAHLKTIFTFRNRCNFFWRPQGLLEFH